MPSFFRCVKWWGSPYINHFISADTIIPSPANPQSWNRYSYVSNNPLRYTDPTGHMQASDDYEDSDGKCGKNDKGCNDVVKRIKDKQDKAKKDRNNPIKNYCGNSSGLACLANATQDIATGIDLVGVVFIEAPAVADGCSAGGPLGCVIAEVGVGVTWTLTMNTAETVASGLSLGFTLLDDGLNNRAWTENSSTSLANALAGTLPLTPSWDFAVDTYASGYNHGFFNGFETVWTNGLFK